MDPKPVKPSPKVRGTTAAPREVKSKPKNAEHPIAQLSGIFKDNPLWDEYFDALRRARAEAAAKEDRMYLVGTGIRSYQQQGHPIVSNHRTRRQP